jgi:hypothetical protein
MNRDLDQICEQAHIKFQQTNELPKESELTKPYSQLPEEWKQLYRVAVEAGRDSAQPIARTAGA